MSSAPFFFTLALLLTVPGLIFGQDIEKEIKKLKSPDRAEVTSGIRNLAKMENKKAESVLVQELKSTKDNYIKVQTIEALTMYQSTTSVEAVISALNDANPNVRQAAMINLGYFGDNERIAQVVAGALENEKDKTVKLSGINTLTQHKNKAAVAALSKISKEDKDLEIRKSTIRVLGKINTKEARDEIKKHTADSDPEIRKEAKKILGK